MGGMHYFAGGLAKPMSVPMAPISAYPRSVVQRRDLVHDYCRVSVNVAVIGAVCVVIVVVAGIASVGVVVIRVVPAVGVVVGAVVVVFAGVVAAVVVFVVIVVVVAV